MHLSAQLPSYWFDRNSWNCPKPNEPNANACSSSQVHKFISSCSYWIFFHEHRAVELVAWNNCWGSCTLHNMRIPKIPIVDEVVVVVVEVEEEEVVVVVAVVVVWTSVEYCTHIASLCLVDLECNWNWSIARVASACAVYLCISVRSVYWSQHIFNKSLKFQKTGSFTTQIQKARR